MGVKMSPNHVVSPHYNTLCDIHVHVHAKIRNVVMENFGNNYTRIIFGYTTCTFGSEDGSATLYIATFQILNNHCPPNHN